MGALPVLQLGGRVPVCMFNDSLPIFYMNDYSVLGLLVSDLNLAYRILTDQHFAIKRMPDHLEVDIERAGQMTEIVSLLDRKGIDCGIADIADQIYQG